MEQTEKTKYYGIYILRMISGYWITNDIGDEIYVGETKPTERYIAEHVQSADGRTAQRRCLHQCQKRQFNVYRRKPERGNYHE